MQRMVLIASALALCAYVLALVANWGCWFVESDLGSIGLWRNQDCKAWTSLKKEEFDLPWHVAQAFSVVVTVIGAITLLLVFCCFKAKGVHAGAGAGISLLFFVCGLVQGVTLVGHRSDSMCDNGASCSWDVGSTLTIFSAVFYVITGWTILCAVRVQHRPSSWAEEEDEQKALDMDTADEEEPVNKRSHQADNQTVTDTVAGSVGMDDTSFDADDSSPKESSSLHDVEMMA